MVLKEQISKGQNLYPLHRCSIRKKKFINDLAIWIYSKKQLDEIGVEGEMTTKLYLQVTLKNHLTFKNCGYVPL